MPISMVDARRGHDAGADGGGEEAEALVAAAVVPGRRGRPPGARRRTGLRRWASARPGACGRGARRREGRPGRGPRPRPRRGAMLVSCMAMPRWVAWVAARASQAPRTGHIMMPTVPATPWAYCTSCASSSMRTGPRSEATVRMRRRAGLRGTPAVSRRRRKVAASSSLRSPCWRARWRATRRAWAAAGSGASSAMSSTSRAEGVEEGGAVEDAAGEKPAGHAEGLAVAAEHGAGLIGGAVAVHARPPGRVPLRGRGPGHARAPLRAVL